MLLTDDQIHERLRELPGWQRAGREIRRVLAFPGFKEAMAFVDRLVALAEEANHHPDILIQYDKVTLSSTSHDSGGLTTRDFRLAAKIDG